MQFAYPLPWWGWLLVIAAVVFVAYGAYTRTALTLAPSRRSALAGLRGLTCLLLVLFLLRPMRLLPPKASQDQPVPVLVDVSRSMNLADAGGKRRIERAADLLSQQLVPAISSQFKAEVLTFGESVVPAPSTGLAATARRSDLAEALEAVRDRYRGRRLPGIVVVSDGGDTGRQDVTAIAESGGVPIFTIGVGDPHRRPDHEVLAVTAGEANVEHALVDLSVSAVSYGYGTTPISIRLLANGRLVDSRQVTRPGDGSPIHDTFLVAPDRAAPTLFTVEIPEERGEAVTENNRRSVLVSPPGRPRRLLFVEGAPGFEHSFIKRAWSNDPSIEVDVSIRKGQNDQGQDTFYLQAPPVRGAALATGFPMERRALYTYDAVVLANIDGRFLNRDQLRMAADSVAERGGGLLMLGALSFARGQFIGTALEEVLPLELSDRGGGIARTSISAHGAPPPFAAAPRLRSSQGLQVQDDGSELYKVLVTDEGGRHPLMRLSADRDETIRRWAQVPPLASTAMLGAARPGAQLLAVTRTPDGGRYPLVAVQRYGRGRSMIFAGEASWRWRMGLPATDRTHEVFWRQVARWLSTGAPDPISIGELDAAMPGELLELDIFVRDADFAAVPDASVIVRAGLPGGESRDVPAALADAASGRYRASLRADQAGLYRVAAEARRGDVQLGSSNQWILVGGADQEMADPRLNEDLLTRLATASGGTYLRESEIATLPGLLTAAQTEPLPPERQDLWNSVWSFAVIVLLLSAEWMLRRRWGMR